MSRSDQGAEPALIYEPRLLPSESQAHFRVMREAIVAELKPRCAIEEMWSCEIIHGEWETQRLRGFKDLILTSARRPALKSLLSIVLNASGAADIDDLAERSFTNKGVRNKVTNILRKYGMSEASIDAEAFRHCLFELGEINRRLAELSSRRDKNLQLLEDYRAGLARPRHPAEGTAVMISGDDGD
ncbi:hypothetical protein [Bradyrhizobium sp. 141]|uniref:hypothetical protein n=1 Tax=Bradyrhizobium sp. 141 TaxID=2782617 RepID=UPI001FFAD229|nr:hypothetical protein [Bradyrhizobium sp. 141]MCK1722626.1 hypothetical protein [Bradyrhizobium sp. 141]